MTRNYDSDFCGSLPLNFINMIQPYGALMVLDKSSYKVIQVSENIGEAFGVTSSEFLNKALSSLILPEQYEDLHRKLSTALTDKIPVTFTISLNGVTENFLAIFHPKENYLIVELEVAEKGKAYSLVYQEVKYIMARLKNAKSTTELFKITAEEIKNFSGFDKVMIYQFDRNWNGFVVAEEKEEGMDSYMGLRFPASDIPKQARELYLRNPYRLIPDRSYTPVNLNPTLNPLNFRYTDLSDCNLRSVPPVHLEYLKNMKVESSMSTSIIKDNQLWGLISCHHRSAKFLNFEMRSAFELVSSYISTQLSAMESERMLKHSSKLREIQNELSIRMIQTSTVADALITKSPTILDLLETDGAAMVFNDRIRTIGNVPEESFIREVLYWLKINGSDKIITTDTVQFSIDNDASHKDKACGFIAIPLSAKKGEYIIGFRPEVLQTVEWGGNPNEAINFEADQKTYHPRNSFSIWKEVVKNTCNPWEPETLEAAEKLKNSILEILVRSNN